MGTLLGHALPGSFFLFYALWRLIQIVRRQQLLRHFRRHGSHLEFYTSATYPCYVGRCSRWPMEGAAKVIMTSVGLVGELYASTNYGRDGKITSLGDIQHVSMYSLFLLSGVVDLLAWCCGTEYQSPGLRLCGNKCAPHGVRFPRGVDFIALSMAFSGELILFSEHTHGRTPIDKHVHYLLLFVLAATVLSVFAECRYRHSLTAALTTTYLLVVQGAWFIQVGLLLYPPRSSSFQRLQGVIYSQTIDDQITVSTLIFLWHLGGALVIVTVTYLVFHALCGVCCRRCEAPLEADNIEFQLVVVGQNTASGSDSSSEFNK